MTTDNTQSELDKILKLHASYHYGGGREGELSDGKAKQAILDWHNKQVLEIIGEDEPTEIWYETEITVASGKKPVTKRVREKTYANAEVHHRNELRAEQRNKLKESE